MEQQLNFLSEVPEEEPETLRTMTLVEKVHYTFDEWLMRRIRTEFTVFTPFAIMQMRVEYLNQCWQDEVKWKEWCNACQKTNEG